MYDRAGGNMNQDCIDIFKIYDLPFETYFAKKLEHLNQLHDVTELIWVMRGYVTIVCDEVTYKMISGTMFMINAFQTHSIISTDDALIISFRFKKQYLESNKLSFQGMNFKNRTYTLDELVLKYKEIPMVISQLLKLLISTKNNNLVRYKIIGYFNMLIYELYTLLLKENYLDIKQKNFDGYLKRLNIIIDYVSNNFKNKITLDELAKLTEISTFRLSHFIKEYMGISFQEFLSNMRLDFALKLLRKTNIKVVEVSRVSGFSDVKYLNKLIKSRFKLTALKYRKMIRENIETIDTDELNYEVFFQELHMYIKNYKMEYYQHS